MFEKLRRSIESRIPGTVLNIALQKKAYQDALRRAGVSRKESMRLTAEHYAKHLRGKQ